MAIVLSREEPIHEKPELAVETGGGGGVRRDVMGNGLGR
jgi:hypothetical protein